MTTIFTPVVFAIDDEFITDRAAGAVNGTAAEPSGQTRTVVDGNSKLTISSGLLRLATGGVAFGNPGYWLSSVTRAPGQLLKMRMILASISDALGGWSTAQSGTPNHHVFNFHPTLGLFILNNGASISVATFSFSATHEIAIPLRTTGAHYLAKLSGSSNWLLYFVSTAGATTTLYPAITTSTTRGVDVDFLRGSPSPTWMPSPVVSDGFASAFGTSDGLGHAEGVATGIGSGGGSVAWSQAIGTWTVGSGKANASALSGGIANAVANSGKADVLAKAKLTISAGNAGVIVRYVDASNYVYAYHNGASNQVTLRKVVAGVDSEVMALTAATYSANAEFLVIADSTKFRVFYNNAAIGAEQTISDSALQSGTKQGIYTSDTGNQFDDFVAYARGTGGEYNAALNLGTVVSTVAQAATSTSSAVLALVHSLATTAASTTSTSSAIVTLAHQLVSTITAATSTSSATLQLIHDLQTAAASSSNTSDTNLLIAHILATIALAQSETGAANIGIPISGLLKITFSLRGANG